MIDMTLLREIITRAAREELLPRFNQVSRSFKGDGSIVTEADLAIQQRIQQALQREWPEIALLGEEMAPEEQQALLARDDPGLWLLDPLDGTSNFAAGIPYFAVSLALYQHGAIQLGLIYDPVRDECFSAQRGAGAQLNGAPLRNAPDALPLKQGIALIDFKRLPARLSQALVTTPPYSSQRSFGSGALDWCWVAAGRVHVYLHGAQKLWDFAAGSLILEEAGGRSATLQGEVVFQASLAPRSVVAAPHLQLFDQWRTCLSALMASSNSP
ncbi:MAG: inositol monophosphatase [Pseudomonadota bacterium]